jgi:hypothetical protein
VLKIFIENVDHHAQWSTNGEEYAVAAGLVFEVNNGVLRELAEKLAGHDGSCGLFGA